MTKSDRTATSRLRRALVAVCAPCLCCAAATAQTPAPATTPAATPSQTATPTGTAQEAAAAQTANDGRVPLTETALARDAAGAVLFGGTLREQPAPGSLDAPARAARFVVENRGAAACSYLAGRVTFYDAAGVRCGEGLFTINSLAAGERSEADAPGLRLTAAPVLWRITPVALVSADRVTTTAPPAVGSDAPAAPTAAATNDLRLTIDINGTRVPLQIGNPVEVEVGGERVRVVVERERP